MNLKIISCAKKEDFEKEYSEFDSNNTIKFTQSHTTIDDGAIIFTAFIFY